MTQTCRRWSVILMLSFGIGSVVAGLQARAGQTAGPATARVDVDALGPKVGDRLLDFALRDQHGDLRPLKSLIGPKGAIVVFFRSADW